jgi:hypothetical protein
LHLKPIVVQRMPHRVVDKEVWLHCFSDCPLIVIVWVCYGSLHVFWYHLHLVGSGMYCIWRICCDLHKMHKESLYAIK